MDHQNAFLAAIKAHESLLYKIAAVYTNDREDRNDLVQEILYQLWKSFDTFSQKSALSTWMYRVAMNVAIHHLKTRKRRVRTVPLDDQVTVVQEAAHHNDEEQWTLLKAQLDHLSLLEKGIVILYLEDKSYEEIADIIGISKSNVGTKLSRIKEKIRQQLSKY